LISTVILAGGQSSRMGRDKALLLIEGKPLLPRICQAALQCTSCVYVVTSWPDRYLAILPDGCQTILETFPLGETQPQGPLVGFAQGLAQTQADWVLLLACDLPCLQVGHLQRWIEQVNTASQDAIALLPRHEKGWEPLCGLYRRSCLASLQEFIEHGGRSFQIWLQQHKIQELVVSDAQALFNCNTPQDWQVINS
jgi:molybdenum cofactor guanylyltransferase